MELVSDPMSLKSSILQNCPHLRDKLQMGFPAYPSFCPRNYKYEGVVLGSGAEVTAIMVTVEAGKVVRVESAGVMTDNGSFNFGIYNYGVDGKKTYSINNVPENVDAQAIVKEFVTFVEADIA